MDDKQQPNDLGQPGEIKQYERHGEAGPVRGDELNNNGADATPIYLTGDSTLQTPDEHRHDQSVDPRKDDTMAASNDDLHETVADRTAGSDRAGTAERKDNSMDTAEES